MAMFDYWRVNPCKSHQLPWKTTIFLWFSYDYQRVISGCQFIKHQTILICDGDPWPGREIQGSVSNGEFPPILGKLESFTHLNCWAIKGDNSPNPNHLWWGRTVRSWSNSPSYTIIFVSTCLSLFPMASYVEHIEVLGCWNLYGFNVAPVPSPHHLGMCSMPVMTVPRSVKPLGDCMHHASIIIC